MLPPVQTPPFNITRASHLALTSCDLAKARDFYTEVIGLKVSHETATAIHFRGLEERGHHSLVLRKAHEQAACERIGFRMNDEEDLERAKAHFGARGIAVKFANAPFQGRTLHVTGPSGVPLEFCARMKAMPRLQAHTHEHKGAAATRLDHCQVALPNVAEALTFYAACGFRTFGYACIGGRIAGALLHRKDNPHDLVLQEGSSPRLQHCGFIVQEMQHLMRALDTAGHLGFGGGIEHGPLRHGYSQRLYLRDPDGHRIALLLPPIQVVDADDGEIRCDLRGGTDDLWGLAPPRSYFEKGTGFANQPIALRRRNGLLPTSDLDMFGERSGFREGGSGYQSSAETAV